VIVAFADGKNVGLNTGLLVNAYEGVLVALSVGPNVGGRAVSAFEGVPVGLAVEPNVGLLVGCTDS
jgi:hypothetical protein